MGALQKTARPQTNHEREVRARVQAKSDEHDGRSRRQQGAREVLAGMNERVAKGSPGRRTEAEGREKRKMGDEDAHSRSRQIREWPIPSLFSVDAWVNASSRKLQN